MLCICIETLQGISTMVDASTSVSVVSGGVHIRFTKSDYFEEIFLVRIFRVL